jgi:hypothetical protein
MPALKLTAKGVKCTLVATPDQIAGFHVPDGSSPVPFAIDAGGRIITGTFNAKSLRRAVAAVTATPGIGHVIVQDSLTKDNMLEGAGISVPLPKSSSAEG